VIEVTVGLFALYAIRKAEGLADRAVDDGLNNLYERVKGAVTRDHSARGALEKLSAEPTDPSRRHVLEHELERAARDNPELKRTVSEWVQTVDEEVLKYGSRARPVTNRSRSSRC
jgi:hypothetical protein